MTALNDLNKRLFKKVNSTTVRSSFVESSYCRNGFPVMCLTTAEPPLCVPEWSLEQYIEDLVCEGALAWQIIINVMEYCEDNGLVLPESDLRRLIEDVFDRKSLQAWHGPPDLFVVKVG